MAIEKNIVDDKIEVVGDYKLIHVRTATVIIEDGVELTRTFSRKVLSPHEDIMSESAELQGIAGVVWTDEVKAAWTAFQAEQSA